MRSDKSESVSQRVAALLVDDVAANSIVAFTITERAARELKERVRVRVAERLASTAVDKLGGLVVGTIHAHCVRLLQSRVARYETQDVLDTNQLNAFLAREAKRLRVRSARGATSTSNGAPSPNGSVTPRTSTPGIPTSSSHIRVASVSTGTIKHRRRQEPPSLLSPCPAPADTLATHHAPPKSEDPRIPGAVCRAMVGPTRAIIQTFRTRPTAPAFRAPR